MRWAVGLLSLAVAAAAAAQGSPGTHGKHRVASYRVPDATLVKYASLKPAAPKPGESALTNVLLADTVDWVSPALDVKANANPYTIVVTVTGRTRAAGDATSMWNAGWKLDSGETVFGALPGIAKTGAGAGDPFKVTATRATSFKEDRTVSVSLGLVNARNLEILDVEIDVWSGVGGGSFADKVLAFRWAILGAILLALGFFGFRRMRA
jgi:hypothetical protein